MRPTFQAAVTPSSECGPLALYQASALSPRLLGIPYGSPPGEPFRGLGLGESWAWRLEDLTTCGLAELHLPGFPSLPASQWEGQRESPVGDGEGVCHGALLIRWLLSAALQPLPLPKGFSASPAPGPGVRVRLHDEEPWLLQDSPNHRGQRQRSTWTSFIRLLGSELLLVNSSHSCFPLPLMSIISSS